MRKREATKCIICGEPVDQDKSTSVERQTCNRVEVNGVMEKSECEKEKNRRYQKGCREDNSKSQNDSSGKPKNTSVAVGDNKHLKKFVKVKKYKRRCLKCNRKFTGKGPYNRLCDKCSIENSRTKSLRGTG